MFVVVTHVERDGIKWAVVRISLVSLLEDVVLWDKVPSHRVQSHRKERAAAEIEKWAQTHSVVDRDVERHLHEEVQHLETRDGLRVEEEGTEGVEDGLKEQPDELASGRREHSRFEARRNVDVERVVALILVMLGVVLLEDGRVRDAENYVAEDADQPVAHRIPIAECDVVRDLMDRESHRVVDDATEAVRDNDDREEWRFSQEIRGNKLHQHHADDNELEIRVVYHQLCHLRVLGCNTTQTLLLKIIITKIYKAPYISENSPFTGLYKTYTQS